MFSPDSISKLRLAVTGASGFIGSAVVDSLGAQKGFKVLPLSRRLSNFGESQGDASYLYSPAHWMTILKDFPVVLHLSGATELNLCESQEPEIQSHNTNLVCSIFAAAKKTGIRPRIVFSSTASVYGPFPALPVDENTPLNPITAYDRIKVSIENQLLEAHEKGTITAVILRLPNIYGIQALPLEGPNRGVVNRTLIQALRGQAPVVWGIGRERRDYVHILDLVSAMVASAKIRESQYPVYNLGSLKPLTVREAFELIAEESTLAAGTKIQVQEEPMDKRQSQIQSRDYFSDGRKFMEEAGWMPTITFREGIRMSIRNAYRFGLV